MGMQIVTIITVTMEDTLQIKILSAATTEIMEMHIDIDTRDG